MFWLTAITVPASHLCFGPCTLDPEQYQKGYGDSKIFQKLQRVRQGYASVPTKCVHIELTTVDEHSITETYTISHDTINTNNTIIQELNQASDFINYKLLHNFYTATHKQEVNLWPVFERDIFPFLMDDANRVMLDKIQERTEDVVRYSSGQPVRGKKAEAVEMEIGALNTEIESLLSQIQTNANAFI